MNEIPTAAVISALLGNATEDVQLHFSPYEIRLSRAFWVDIVDFSGDAAVSPPKKMLDILIAKNYITDSDLTNDKEQYWRWTDSGEKFFRSLIKIQARLAHRTKHKAKTCDKKVLDGVVDALANEFNIKGENK